jgi:steroid delta-isomerase-like uncharacterized protein
MKLDPRDLANRVLPLLLLALCRCAASAPGVQPCATPPARVDQNKAVAARVFTEILGQGRFDLTPALYDPAFVNHATPAGVGLAEDQAAAKTLRAMYPDATIAVRRMVGDGDLVSVLWHATGTHTGAVEGVPPTGKKIDVDGMTLWRIVDGRITEEWSQFPDPLQREK